MIETKSATRIVRRARTREWGNVYLNPQTPRQFDYQAKDWISLDQLTDNPTNETELFLTQFVNKLIDQIDGPEKNMVKRIRDKVTKEVKKSEKSETKREAESLTAKQYGDGDSIGRINTLLEILDADPDSYFKTLSESFPKKYTPLAKTGSGRQQAIDGEKLQLEASKVEHERLKSKDPEWENQIETFYGKGNFPFVYANDVKSTSFETLKGLQKTSGKELKSLKALNPLVLQERVDAFKTIDELVRGDGAERYVTNKELKEFLADQIVDFRDRYTKKLNSIKSDYTDFVNPEAITYNVKNNLTEVWTGQQTGVDSLGSEIANNVGIKVKGQVNIVQAKNDTKIPWGSNWNVPIAVVGTNKEMRDGRGAALDAKKFRQMTQDSNSGLNGGAYRFNTKETPYKSLEFSEVEKNAIELIEWVKKNPDKKIDLTAVGTKNAGFTVEQMAPLFADLYKNENVRLPKDFLKELHKQEKIPVNKEQSYAEFEELYYEVRGGTPKEFKSLPSGVKVRINGKDEIDFDIKPLTYSNNQIETALYKGKYEVTASGSQSYAVRTKANVENTDGTIVFGSKNSAGSKATIRFAKNADKPLLENPKTAQEVLEWMSDNNIKKLNIAGSSSEQESIDLAKRVLTNVFVKGESYDKTASYSTLLKNSETLDKPLAKYEKTKSDLQQEIVEKQNTLNTQLQPEAQKLINRLGVFNLTNNKSKSAINFNVLNARALDSDLAPIKEAITDPETKKAYEILVELEKINTAANFAVSEAAATDKKLRAVSSGYTVNIDKSLSNDLQKHQYASLINADFDKTIKDYITNNALKNQEVIDDESIKQIQSMIKADYPSAKEMGIENEMVWRGVIRNIVEDGVFKKRILPQEQSDELLESYNSVIALKQQEDVETVFRNGIVDEISEITSEIDELKNKGKLTGTDNKKLKRLQKALKQNNEELIEIDNTNKIRSERITEELEKLGIDGNVKVITKTQIPEITVNVDGSRFVIMKDVTLEKPMLIQFDEYTSGAKKAKDDIEQWMVDVYNVAARKNSDKPKEISRSELQDTFLTNNESIFSKWTSGWRLTYGNTMTANSFTNAWYGKRTLNLSGIDPKYSLPTVQQGETLADLRFTHSSDLGTEAFFRKEGDIASFTIKQFPNDWGYDLRKRIQNGEGKLRADISKKSLDSRIESLKTFETQNKFLDTVTQRHLGLQGRGLASDYIEKEAVTRIKIDDYTKLSNEVGMLPTKTKGNVVEVRMPDGRIVQTRPFEDIKTPIVEMYDMQRQKFLEKSGWAKIPNANRDEASKILLGSTDDVTRITTENAEIKREITALEKEQKQLKFDEPELKEEADDLAIYLKNMEDGNMSDAEIENSFMNYLSNLSKRKGFELNGVTFSSSADIMNTREAAGNILRPTDVFTQIHLRQTSPFVEEDFGFVGVGGFLKNRKYLNKTNNEINNILTKTVERDGKTESVTFDIKDANTSNLFTPEERNKLTSLVENREQQEKAIAQWKNKSVSEKIQAIAYEFGTKLKKKEIEVIDRNIGVFSRIQKLNSIKDLDQDLAARSIAKELRKIKSPKIKQRADTLDKLVDQKQKLTKKINDLEKNILNKKQERSSVYFKSKTKSTGTIQINGETFKLTDTALAKQLESLRTQRQSLEIRIDGITGEAQVIAEEKVKLANKKFPTISTKEWQAITQKSNYDENQLINFLQNNGSKFDWDAKRLSNELYKEQLTNAKKKLRMTFINEKEQRKIAKQNTKNLQKISPESIEAIIEFKGLNPKIRMKMEENQIKITKLQDEIDSMRIKEKLTDAQKKEIAKKKREIDVLRGDDNFTNDYFNAILNNADESVIKTFELRKQRVNLNKQIDQVKKDKARFEFENKWNAKNNEPGGNLNPKQIKQLKKKQQEFIDKIQSLKDERDNIQIDLPDVKTGSLSDPDALAKAIKKLKKSGLKDPKIYDAKAKDTGKKSSLETVLKDKAERDKLREKVSKIANKIKQKKYESYESQMDKIKKLPGSDEENKKLFDEYLKRMEQSEEFKIATLRNLKGKKRKKARDALILSGTLATASTIPTFAGSKP